MGRCSPAGSRDATGPAFDVAGVHSVLCNDNTKERGALDSFQDYAICCFQKLQSPSFLLTALSDIPYSLKGWDNGV